MRSAEVARILRPPGTLNFKSDPPSRVACVALDVTAHAPAAVVGDLPDPPDRRPREERPSGPTRPLSAVPDRLGDICPPEYFRALTGLVPDRGGKVACPLADHDDSTPSCHVFQDAARGWFCHGCQRGGTIYDLAALLGGYPMPLRSADFIAVRTVLLDHLGGEVAA